MFKKFGIGKSLLLYVSTSAILVLVISSFFFLTSQKALSNLTAASNDGLNMLRKQNSLIKSMALVHSNILPLASEKDKDSRDIRIEIARGFMTEIKKTITECGEPCKAISAGVEAYDESWSGVQASLAKGDLEASANIIMSKLNPQAEKIFDALDKTAIAANKATIAEFEVAEKDSSSKKNMLIGMILGLVTLIMAVGFFFQKKLVQAIQSVVMRVSSSVQEAHDKSRTISDSSETLSSSATRQAASVEETVASIEEMSSMISRNAENAKLAAGLSSESSQAASEGGDEIKNLITSMKGIFTSSKKIEEIISVIDDIAFQTNLLALNAAVEAARAGEQGKGFAVVAEAVRTLAQRSAEAAKEISTLIKDSVSQTETGTKIADKSGDALQKIIQSIQKVSHLNSEISVASQEQAQGIQQLSKAMVEIDQTTQTNAAEAESVSTSSGGLLNEVQVLEEATAELNQLLKGGTPPPPSAHSHEEPAAPAARPLKKAA